MGLTPPPVPPPGAPGRGGSASSSSAPSANTPPQRIKNTTPQNALRCRHTHIQSLSLTFSHSLSLARASSLALSLSCARALSRSLTRTRNVHVLRSHVERRCSHLGPTQIRITPCILQYTKKKSVTQRYPIRMEHRVGDWYKSDNIENTHFSRLE